MPGLYETQHMPRQALVPAQFPGDVPSDGTVAGTASRSTSQERDGMPSSRQRGLPDVVTSPQPPPGEGSRRGTSSGTREGTAAEAVLATSHNRLLARPKRVGKGWVAFPKGRALPCGDALRPAPRPPMGSGGVARRSVDDHHRLILVRTESANSPQKGPRLAVDGQRPSTPIHAAQEGVKEFNGRSPVRPQSCPGSPRVAANRPASSRRRTVG